MKLNKVVAMVNELLAGERHTYTQLINYLDRAVDDINAQLNTTFPVFSELPEGSDEYVAIPDRYIRSVVTVGAAWYYFTADEEGEIIGQQYMYNYERGLFVMVRDYIMLVPLEYRADVVIHPDTGEYVYGPDVSLDLDEDRLSGKRGVVVDASNILP